MSIQPHSPDDELVSAYLDGEATPSEIDRVEGDRALMARVEAFRSVSAAVSITPSPDDDVRNNHLTAVLAAAAATPETLATAPAARRITLAERMRRFLPAAGLVAAAALAVPIGVAVLSDGNDSDTEATSLSNTDAAGAESIIAADATESDGGDAGRSSTEDADGGVETAEGALERADEAAAAPSPPTASTEEAPALDDPTESGVPDGGSPEAAAPAAEEFAVESIEEVPAIATERLSEGASQASPSATTSPNTTAAADLNSLTECPPVVAGQDRVLDAFMVDIAGDPNIAVVVDSPGGIAVILTGPDCVERNRIPLP